MERAPVYKVNGKSLRDTPGFIFIDRRNLEFCTEQGTIYTETTKGVL